VEELLEALVAQGIADCEILVVDNGSTDETPELVEACARADPRIRLLRSAASSAGAARNEGTAAARGEYLVFADSDDLVPDGAYGAMLESLERSGSDMAIGDHLKFSPTATWSPTERWRAFDEAREAAAPEDVPAVLTGRACWNRMFRRSFWERIGLRFPEIASLEDIEPMTRAFVGATSVDVVQATVYLYRDRTDGASISQAVDAAAMLRYLQQEQACARLLHDRPALLEQYVRMVLDADGWSHLSRFLASRPSGAEVSSVAAALADFAAVVPLDTRHDVAPARRLLWDLVLLGEWDAAERFIVATNDGDAEERLGAWRLALSALSDGNFERRRIASLVDDGLLPTLVNHADAVPMRWLREALSDLQVLPSDGGDPGLRSAMADAVRRGDASSAAAVSALRHIVPLVVSSAVPTTAGLTVSGPFRTRGNGFELQLALRSESAIVTLPIATNTETWSAVIDAERLAVGRWTVSVLASGVDEEFPVVTARMPLPPISEPFTIQPLADRKDAWRFVVDRRRSGKARIASLLSRVGRRFR